MMLRDDLQVALNDVVVALQDAVNGHEHALTALGERAEAGTLRRLVEVHARDAEIIADHLRALGDRPREADSDYETVLDLVSQVKATLAPDDTRSLLEDRAEAEARVAETAECALEYDDLADEIGAALTRIRDEARAAAGELGAA